MILILPYSEFSGILFRLSGVCAGAFHEHLGINTTERVTKNSPSPIRDSSMLRLPAVTITITWFSLSALIARRNVAVIRHCSSKHSECGLPRWWLVIGSNEARSSLHCGNKLIRNLTFEAQNLIFFIDRYTLIAALYSHWCVLFLHLSYQLVSEVHRHMWRRDAIIMSSADGFLIFYKCAFRLFIVLHLLFYRLQYSFRNFIGCISTTPEYISSGSTLVNRINEISCYKIKIMERKSPEE